RVNIEAGQDWAARLNEVDDEAAQLSIDYTFYLGANFILSLRQHPRARIHWLEVAVSASRRLKRREAEGILLGGLGSAYSDLDELHKATEFNEPALVIFREIGDHRHEGAVLNNLGNIYKKLS